MEDYVCSHKQELWNIKSYVLYRMVPLSMTLSDPEPYFQGHSIA